jgi:hypothetical protein
VRVKGDYPKKSKKLGAGLGEYRANGNQSIIDGIHPYTGERYIRLIDAPPMEIKFSDIVWPEGIEPPCPREELSLDAWTVSPGFQLTRIDSIDEAVRISLPTQERQNNASIMTLARALKFNLGHTLGRPITIQERDAAFELWLAQIRYRGFARENPDHYMKKLKYSLKHAKKPLGETPIESAWKKVETEPAPAEASNFIWDDVAFKLLSLCFQMEQVSPGEWFVPVHTASKLINTTNLTTTPRTCARWLRRFVDKGFLREMKHSIGMQATRYRWIGSGLNLYKHHSGTTTLWDSTNKTQCQLE